MSWCAPISTIEFFRQWDNSWQGSGLQAISKWALPYFGLDIWKEHNNRIFRDASLPAKIVSGKIQNALLENYMFIKGSNPFTGETSTNNDTQTRRKECHWSLPHEGWHKANFDGVAKGNLGAARCGGVIKNSHGNRIVAVTFPLRHQTNYYAKACAALQTTKLEKEVRVKSLWLEEDSNNIIKCLRGEHPLSWSIKNMMEETKSILLSFKRVYVSHVYREGNAVADWMANEVVRRDTSHGWKSGEGILTVAKSLIEIERIQGRMGNIKCNCGS